MSYHIALAREVSEMADRSFCWRMLRTALVIACLGVSAPLTALAQYSEGFESGYGDWSVSNGVWQIGTPTNGPAACHTGSGCAATNLTGNYPAYSETQLESGPIDLPTIASGQELQLRLWHWFSYSSFDAGTVRVSVFDEASGWGEWGSLGDSVAGVGVVWTRLHRDLSVYAGRRIRLGFLHYSTRECGSCGSESSGWYVDDLQIVVISPVFDGTFEAGLSDWSVSNGVWQVGAPAAGPTECKTPVGCAGTGNYPAYSNTRLESAPINLPTIASGQELQLRLWHWFSYSSFDTGTVQISVYDGVSDWGEWEPLGDSVAGVGVVWTRLHRDLSVYAGRRIRLGFLHYSTRECGSCGSESSGWYVDDLQIVVISPVFEGTFEAGISDWSVSNGVWEVGTPTAGPTECKTSTRCAGTVLAGGYPAYSETRLESAPINLPTATGGQELQLRLWHWFSYSSFDTGTVQISVYDTTSGWGEWDSLGSVVGGVGQVWTPLQRDLKAYSGRRIRLGFLHYSTRECGSCGSESTGWYIDDISIYFSGGTTTTTTTSTTTSSTSTTSSSVPGATSTSTTTSTTLVPTCAQLPAGTSCDDGNPCTTGDVCAAGACGGEPVDCSALNDACGQGVCDAESGACVKQPIASAPECTQSCVLLPEASTCGRPTCGTVCGVGSCVQGVTRCAIPVDPPAKKEKRPVVINVRVRAPAGSVCVVVLVSAVSRVTERVESFFALAKNGPRKLSKRVKGRVGESGQIELPLKLNRVGKQLLRDQESVQIEAQVEVREAGKEPQLLTRLITLVRR